MSISETRRPRGRLLLPAAVGALVAALLLTKTMTGRPAATAHETLTWPFSIGDLLFSQLETPTL